MNNTFKYLIFIYFFYFSTLDAYEYLGARWAIEEGPVSYVLDPSGSDDITDGSDLIAIDRAFQKWSCIEKSGLRLLN